MEDFISLAAAVPDRRFNLYAIDHTTDELEREAKRTAGSVTIPGPIDHDDMPAEYKKHNWIVKTGDTRRRTMGWPVSIAEAQASGVGVCMANLGRDLEEYVGPAGFLFDSLAEAKSIISKPFPDELREAGFQQAQKSDIAQHRSVLIDLWRPAFRNRRVVASPKAPLRER
jgi:glycosyltransferase involved in cell wall biosynthesis